MTATYRPTITEYKALEAWTALFRVDTVHPIFHALRILRDKDGGLAVLNWSTTCGRSVGVMARYPSTMLPLRHARLFGRPCARCFRPETTP